MRCYACMSASTNGRVLRIALAGSVAVHLLIAAIVYSHPVYAQPEQPPKPLHMYRLVMQPPPTPTPPPPKPAVHRPRKNAPQTRRPIRTVMPPVLPPTNLGRAQPHPPVQPPGTPEPLATAVAAAAGPTDGPIAPTPTPKPACTAPDVPAHAVETAQAVYPDDAQTSGFVGETQVKVSLDAAGAIVAAGVYASSGSFELDRAAVQAARASRFAPEQVHCKNVAGSYLFKVDFQ